VHATYTKEILRKVAKMPDKMELYMNELVAAANNPVARLEYKHRLGQMITIRTGEWRLVLVPFLGRQEDTSANDGKSG
jgi:hypothetical protein